MPHRIHSSKRRRHVLRPGEFTNYGTCSLWRQRDRPAQQRTHAVATRWHFPQQVLTDKAGGAGKCEQHMWSLLPRSCSPDGARLTLGVFHIAATSSSWLAATNRRSI